VPIGPFRHVTTIDKIRQDHRRLELFVCVAVDVTHRHTHVYVDMENGEVGDVQQLGVTESYRVKQQALVSGAEAAEMILRVDNILRSAPRQRHPDYRPC